jgi:hypothetical protein
MYPCSRVTNWLAKISLCARTAKGSCLVCVQKAETAGLGQTTFSLAKLVLDDLIIGHIKDELSICTKSKKQLFRTVIPFQWPLKLKALHISKREKIDLVSTPKLCGYYGPFLNHL